MIIGGYAVIAQGVKRMTTDVDLVVRGDAVRIEELVERLAVNGLEPRIEDAVAFARQNLVLLLRDRSTRVEVDLSFGWSPFEHEAIDKHETARIGDVEVPIARAEDLLIYKAVAGRTKDIEDARTLLLLHPNIDVARARRLVSELADTAEAPEMVERLEALLKARRRR